MKKILNYTALLALCVMVVLSSCEKEEDETLLYLDGTPQFELPLYASVGDTITLYGSGILTENHTFKWTFPGLDTVSFSKDSTSVTICMPDSLATYTVTLQADAGDEYYASSMSHIVTVVSEDKSITGLPVPKKRFVDTRDSKVYPYVQIGNLEWFAKNLNWEGKGIGYASTEAAASVFGRFYTWNDATGGVSASGLGNGVQGVCPEGWSIPTREEIGRAHV